MTSDTITIKLTVQANFQTIQTIRRLFSAQGSRDYLAKRVAQPVHQLLQTYQVGDFERCSQVNVSRFQQRRKGPRDPLPVLQNGALVIWDHNAQRQIVSLKIDTPDWQQWLQQHLLTSFRYQSPISSFTVSSHRRQQRRVWYAHKSKNGKRHRLYLGKPENVTAANLRRLASRFAAMA